MKAATLKGLALHTADDAGIAGPDPVFGWGLLNAKKAAETITKKGTQSMIEERTLTSGTSYSITVNSDGISPLVASISWTDRPGTPNAYGVANDPTPRLINDLDIRVTKNGTTSYPYRLTSVSTNGVGDNIVDPYERVDVIGASGTYTITVTNKGTLVGGSQNYSLIVTGVTINNTNCQSTLTITAPITTTQTQQASQSITASNTISGSTTTVKYRAGNYIDLINGFYAQTGTNLFDAVIGACNSTARTTAENTATNSTYEKQLEPTTQSTKIFPNPSQAETTLEVTLPETSVVSVAVYDMAGRMVKSVLPSGSLEAGLHQYSFFPEDNGTYLATFIINGKKTTKKILIQK